MRRPKPVACHDCGITVVRTIRPDRVPRCTDCALAAMARAAQQMHDHTGDAWRKWTTSNARGAR